MQRFKSIFAKSILALALVAIAIGAPGCGKKKGPQSTQAALEGDNSAVFDWKEVFDGRKDFSPFTNASFYIGTDNVAGAMAYNVSRYRIMSLNYMFKKTRDLEYLDLAKLDVDRMFDPQYFKDCNTPGECNGFDDGLKSWAFKVGTAIHHHKIPRLQWTHFKLSAKDIVDENQRCFTRYSIEVAGDPKPLAYTEETERMATCLPGGTLALYSSWAKTGFRNLVLQLDSSPSDPPLYSLNDRLGSFGTDWVRIMNEDSTFLHDTGEWSLEKSGVISSDATRNGGEGFYYPYEEGDPDNHGLPSNMRASGKVSGLVLKPEALFPGVSHEEAQERLRNYTVEGEILLDLRNWSWAENAVGIRTYADSQAHLYQGVRVHEPLPGNTCPEHPTQRNRYGGIELGSRNTHFDLRPRSFKTNFSTIGAISFFESSFLGGPGQQRPYLVNKLLESESLTYEGAAAQGALEWARLVYETLQTSNSSRIPASAHVKSLLDSADNAVVQFHSHILPKFYGGEARFDPNFILGGLTTQSYDGDTRRLYGDVNRAPLLAVQMLKIARQFPDRWRAIVLAHPWNLKGVKMPTPEALVEYFEKLIRETVKLVVDSTWIDKATGAAQWFGQAGDFWAEFSTSGSDLQHNALTFYFLTEAMDLGFFRPEQLAPYAKTFTKIIWNQNTGGWDGTTARLMMPSGFSMDNAPMGNPNLIDLSVDVHGHGSASIGTMMNTAQLSDYWILLARSDFKVYEIMNRWLQGAWNVYGSIWYLTSSFFRIQPAQLYYMVKYGIPKNLKVELGTNADTTEPPSVKVSWHHPSDWPEGTTLRFYNIYRRISSSSSDQAGVISQFTVPTLQTSFIDTDVKPGARYNYWVKSQDHSETKNESDPTQVLSIQIPQ